MTQQLVRARRNIGEEMGWFFISRFESPKRLDGQVAIVTGCNTGIGYFTALDLARRGAHVVMACRNVEKAEKAAEDIRSSVPNADLQIIKLDLSSLESVRSFCKEFLSCHESLNLLINNAGLFLNTRSLTTDGFEMQFGTNYLGHYLLTLLLLPVIIKSAPSRIVNVSSEAHKYFHKDRIDPMLLEDDLNMEKYYSKWRAYGRSKLGNVLFTKQLAKLLHGTDVKVVSLHPGVIQTEIGRDLKQNILMNIFGVFISWFLRSAEDGAHTTLFCALDDSVQSGLYYNDCAVGTTSDLVNNPEIAKRLWDKSKELVKLGDFDPFSTLHKK